jgi:hypothetical protein
VSPHCRRTQEGHRRADDAGSGHEEQEDGHAGSLCEAP